MTEMTPAIINADTGYITNIDAIKEQQYQSLADTTYLDHAGTTPYPKALIEAFSQDLLSNLLGNPHSASASSQLSSQRVDDVRLKVLNFFNADPGQFDIIFTANATAAIKLVADAFRDHPLGFGYAYHIDSHTSLVGVRELSKGALCFSTERSIADFLESKASNCNDAQPALIGYPGQSNMTGRRYGTRWSESINRKRAQGFHNVYTLYDAASQASTSPVDLSNMLCAPSFTAVSFYKIFGFPDLGALVVRKDCANILSGRKYFGGGTVEVVSVSKDAWHACRESSVHRRMEDGTLPFHSIIALEHAIRIHKQLFGSMTDVSRHCNYLCQLLREDMQRLRHGNGAPVCQIHGIEDEGFQSSGPIISFNLVNANGAYLSNAEVDKLAIVNKIHLRTGGLCNPGGTSNYLNLSSEDLRENHARGHRCGDGNDIVQGRPVGTIRVSLGATSSLRDIQKLVAFLEEYFVDPIPELARVPSPDRTPEPNQFIIESLTVFPIKSCAAFNVPEDTKWEVGQRGLAWDREWCLVHQGTCQALSQKKYPRMALLRPTIDLEKRQLRVVHNIHGSGRQQLVVSLDEDPSTINPVRLCQAITSLKNSSVCGDAVEIEHYISAEVSSFFTEALGVPCTLGRFPRTAALRQPIIRRQTGDSPINQHDKSRSVALANESPILLISRSSVNRLNEQIKARGGVGKTVPAESFRGNIIISEQLSRGQSENPYVEEGWTDLSVERGQDETRFEILGPCQRCQMVSIDQGDGSRRREPFSTLAKTRRKDGNVWFGMHMALSGGTGGPVQVGDCIRPSSRIAALSM
jgi:molybdenum cofactor sulfurtransferase